MVMRVNYHSRLVTIHKKQWSTIIGSNNATSFLHLFLTRGCYVLTRGLRSIHELLGWVWRGHNGLHHCKLVPRALSFHTKRRPLPLYYWVLASTVFYRTLGIQPWKYPENQLTMYTLNKPVCKRQILSVLIEYKKLLCYNTSSEGFIHCIAGCLVPSWKKAKFTKHSGRIEYGILTYGLLSVTDLNHMAVWDKISRFWTLSLKRIIGYKVFHIIVSLSACTKLTT